MSTQVQFGIQHVLGAPLGMPLGIPTQTYVNRLSRPNLPPSPPPEIPGQDLKRAINYLADYGGCGYYRCMAPNFLLNLYQKAVVIESTSMITDPRFYATVQTIKFQRQATPPQKDFIRNLKEMAKTTKHKLVYEIDDVIFAEDIPLYNKNRDAFTPKEIQNSIKEILTLMDEIVVTCDYFKDYIIEKSGNKNVTVVPNYLMKWWFDRYYNLGELIKRYEKNKKKPTIAIFASGTHVDIENRTNHKDDFEAVVNHIIKTRFDFDWHFYGSFPMALRPYIVEGKIKFTKWVPLPEFAESVGTSGAQLTFAALQDNNFNRCKSNIKLIEAGAAGIPCVCPDMVTYKDALLKYKTGDEFIDCIKHALKNQTIYADLCKKSRSYAEKFWLDTESNLMKHHEIYFTPFGSSERKYLA
jgi:glycosyltransferase involved in cell wall biosynthesis